jgi:3-deoxy-manno-octulosonate cytidylyltransferase (CMP-KDO synthetase)
MIPNKTVAVIPARYESSRFPGKPLALIAGKPMIQRVYDQVQQSSVDEVLVATDDQRIVDCVEGFGGKAVMTRSDHPTGTDRIAEAVQSSEASLVINVQGDEPLIPPAVIDELVDAMRNLTDAEMGTVAVPFSRESADFANPNVVKVVVGDNHALYFSRAPIPHRAAHATGDVQPMRHWGIYAYRREYLEQFVQWPAAPLEECEKLEQLRALAHGAKIYVVTSDAESIGVDVPQDVAKVEALL